jgi:hypothetical protein
LPEGLRRTTELLRQDSGPSGGDFNPESSEYGIFHHNVRSEERLELYLQKKAKADCKLQTLWPVPIRTNLELWSL